MLPAVASSPGAARYGAALEGGRELEILALFVDLRESTRLATGRLPYDTLFIFDRYIQAVTAAVRQNFGHVTSIAGDGVMSVDSLPIVRRQTNLWKPQQQSCAG